MSSQTVSAPATAAQAVERNFYVAMALVFALIVLLGFAPTYYLGRVDLPPLSATVHLHGAVFTAWIALLTVQATLVRATRLDLHRTLGVVGTLLAIALLALGYLVAIDRAASGRTINGIPTTFFLSNQLTSLALFAGLVCLAVYFRRTGDIHKRLMLLATISILGPAISRFGLTNLIGLKGPWIIFAMQDALIVACALHDKVTRGRPHRAYVWAGAVFVASQPLRLMIGRTEAWHSIATWLMS